MARPWRPARRISVGPDDQLALQNERLSRMAHGFPKDGFYAGGNPGQRIYIIPSERMVIARFGYTAGDLRLLKAAIADLKGR